MKVDVNVRDIDAFKATAEALKYAMLHLNDEQFEKIKLIYKKYGIEMEKTKNDN